MIWIFSFYDKIINIYSYKANLNIDGSGAVVAAPDQSTPGKYNWKLFNFIGGLSLYSRLYVRGYLEWDQSTFPAVKPKWDKLLIVVLNVHILFPWANKIFYVGWKLVVSMIRLQLPSSNPWDRQSSVPRKCCLAQNYTPLG